MPIALLAAVLPSFIGFAEKLFSKSVHGDQAGAKKKALVTDLVLANIQVLADHDLVPDWAAGDAADAAISEAIEQALTHWKANPPPAVEIAES